MTGIVDPVLWFGIAEMAPASDCEVIQPSRNAFANVIGRASSEDDFRARVAEECEGYRLILQDLREIQLYASKYENAKPPDEIARAAQTVSTELARFYW